MVVAVFADGADQKCMYSLAMVVGVLRNTENPSVPITGYLVILTHWLVKWLPSKITLLTKTNVRLGHRHWP